MKVYSSDERAGRHDDRLHVDPEAGRAEKGQQVVDALRLADKRVIFNKEMIDGVEPVDAVEQDVRLSPLDVQLQQIDRSVEVITKPHGGDLDA